ncbi:4183_t:CDS:2 [Cetraspora pellucida]|uniref:4183_t:CDS:1 n=1 Tax=Cetraspora pellucida TaxID=1433469 RepID=A0A9N9EY70_9GLOM|nr:4183_t:CDS:2 [Cetraspora pellucida]
MNFNHNYYENTNLNITIRENTDSLECNKLSQLLFYLTGTSKTTLTGNAAVNVSESTIYSTCRFSFNEGSNYSKLSNESLC